MTTSTMLETAPWRSEFPGLDSRVFLSGCSLAPRWLGQDVALARMLRAMADERAPWHVFEAEMTLARQRFAQLIHAEPDEIALVPNATVGAYQAAGAQDWQRRPGIVAATDDFPSISHVWGGQRGRGARPVFVEHPLSAKNYRRHLDMQTGLVSVPLVTYLYGARTPTAEICESAAAVGARSFVDAYQGAGVVPIDVRELGCDYLVAGGSKYLLGLPGVAFLYCRRGSEGGAPTLTGWMARDAPHNFDPQATALIAGARRFETGTHPVPAVMAANEGLKLIAEVGVVAIYEHVSALRDSLLRRAAELGISTVGADVDLPHGAHVAFPEPDPQRAADALASYGISVSPRAAVLRVALHLYSSERDIAAFFDGMQRFRTCPASRSATASPSGVGESC